MAARVWGAAALGFRGYATMRRYGEVCRYVGVEQYREVCAHTSSGIVNVVG